MTIIFDKITGFTDFQGTSVMLLNNKISHVPHTGRVLNCVENIGNECYNSHVTSNLFVLLVKNIDIYRSIICQLVTMTNFSGFFPVTVYTHG